MLIHFRVAACIATSVFLAACGGGGDEPCSTQSTLFIGFSYQSMQFGAATPASHAPVVTGLPASCVGKVSFSAAPQASISGIPNVWPSTLSLDTQTGIISGTLAFQPGVCQINGVNVANSTNPACPGGILNGRSYYDVSMHIPGYKPVTYSTSPTFVP